MSTIDQYLNKSFTNPYLSSVSFEIRFPSRIRILKEICKFQEKVNQKYPNYTEEFPINLEKVNVDSFRRILLTDLEENTTIRVQFDRISIIISDYTNFNEFFNRVTLIIDEFSSCFEIKKLIRIGLRYIQKYPFSEKRLDEVQSTFSDYFVPLFNMEKTPINSLLGQNILIRKKLSANVGVSNRSRFHKNKEKGYEYILDFDLYTLETVSIEDYKDLLKDLRSRDKVEFLGYVTLKFLDDNMKEVKVD